MILLQLTEEYPATFRFSVPLYQKLSEFSGYDIIDCKDEADNITDCTLDAEDVVDCTFQNGVSTILLARLENLQNHTVTEQPLSLLSVNRIYATVDMTLWQRPDSGQYRLVLKDDANNVYSQDLLRMIAAFDDMAEHEPEREIKINKDIER